MEQLLIHLWGDFITQTDWMATNKRKRTLACFLHAVVYTLGFFLLTLDWRALAMIGVTHFFIDRFGMARYVVFIKNKINEPSMSWQDCQGTGFPSDRPAWMAVWLLIIVDNTIHLTINYFALEWFA